ncbi:SAM-dependent methyltransferase [Legionella wadsworthii]|uniref:SAM-dependent methyltransferase n=1 Tax=Legionella wadsworthii TaxID=28088 RepID=A0A378LUN5_9GAMM|nr:class I SAM-dependent methyltransferase [Legionella wadsworthii]STY29539.1 SAM-dependent methyltransferase [Legionella wadsworthii]
MDCSNWNIYYKKTKQLTIPRKTVVKAIELFHDRKTLNNSLFAIDLGCGAGNDSIELLRNKWSVLAIDSQVDALSTLENSCPQSLKSKLVTKIAKFETIRYLPPCQLINASFSLPFVKREFFYPFWEIILNTLSPKGIFSGAFFGIKDDWYPNKDSDMTFLTPEELDNLFIPFKILWLDEKEHFGVDASGSYFKYWHQYLVVAEKI